MTDEDERFPAGHLGGVARCGQLEKRGPAYFRTDLIILLTVISLSSDLMAK